ncbi:hypothetical protein [Bradyrhizobium sp. ORS 375]|uniref:hypothetical protein n=1 Tax=Bradyrhizobium sp. (strain ORS 375) TaxID=566679 RepID=UPI00031E13E0|nr:hypothetical protein [Bradyrhizobium sp. ORS 375]
MAISDLRVTCQLVEPVRDPVHRREQMPHDSANQLDQSLARRSDTVAARDSRSIAAIAD